MSSIGLYEVVPISYVRAEAKQMLRLQNDSSVDDEIDFSIIRGLKNLKCLSTLTLINCTIPIDGSTAKLPDGCVELLTFRNPLGLNNGEINSPNNTFYYNAPFFKNYGGTAESGWLPFSNFCQINNGFIMFNIPPNVDELEIAYMAANKDNCGEPIIYERYQDALANFACYNFGLARVDENKYPQLAKWEQRWINQRNMLIGEDQLRKFRENINKIRAVMLSLYYVPRIAPHG